MSKHTPGPWGFSTEPQPNGCPIVGSRGLMVAMLAHTVNQDDQRETALANARLIAAAPDLLELLEDVISIGGGMVEEIYGYCFVERARAAIAKATGGEA